jgi:sortase A
MTPDENSSSQDGAPLLPQRAPVDTPTTDVSSSQQAAANVVRAQLDSIYGGSTPAATVSVAAQTPTSTEPEAIAFDAGNPYERTHDPAPQPNAEQWQKYHSAWQNYYQKYYEGYYTHHLNKVQENGEQTGEGTTYFADQPVEPTKAMDEKLTTDEALFDLRQSLLTKVQTSATKVRKSRHFFPILAGLVVVLVFVFLQYNRVFIATVEAYVVPGASDPQNLIIDPTADVDVGPDNLLIIPKLNINVPTIYGVGTDYNDQMAAMVNGVANFPIPGANSVPGQVGNTVFAGHSSNDITDVGSYKYIFAKLDQLTIGDNIYINYHSKRYVYTVTKTQVVDPTDVSALVYPTTKPILTLITCTPLGTALHRLLVTAEQISPDPTTATAAPSAPTTGKKVTSIPGESPTLFEKIFGG